MTLLSMLDVRVNRDGTTHTACFVRGQLDKARVDKIFAAPEIADAAYCPEGSTSYVAVTVRGTAQDAMNTLALLGIDRPQDCPPLDDEDFDAAGWAITMRDQIEGPRMGDFVRGPDDRLKRIAAVHQTVLQTTDGTPGASFYLDDDGTCAFSGGLDAPIPKSRLSPENDTTTGEFWIFHHGHRVEGGDARFQATCRTYRDAGRG